MAGVTAHGATFTYNGYTGAVVGLTVESPVAETVDMTGVGDGVGVIRLVPTGDWSGGGMTVDVISNRDPQSLVRSTGVASISSQGFSVARRVILESASIEAKAGDVVRASLKFRITDYVGA